MSESEERYLTRNLNCETMQGESNGTDNMSHAEAISKIRNRKVAKLLEEIDGDSQPHKLIRSIKKAFNHMANDFETYANENIGEHNDQDRYYNDTFGE